MNKKIAAIVERLEAFEKEMGELAASLRSQPPEIKDALEDGFIHTAKQSEINGRIAAVDGGLLAQELHGLHIVLVRALSAIFDYKNSKLISNAYHPSQSPEPGIHSGSSLEGHEFAWHKSLLRIKAELEVAKETIEKFSPNCLLMDGSLVPQIADKPSDDSEIRPLFNEVIDIYRALYSKAESNGCALLGVIKDSRGKRFVDIIAKSADTILSSNDTNFLHFLLRQGERTFAFNYAGTAKKHPVIKDLGEWGSRIAAFYIKPTNEDRPLRVEILDGKNDFSSSASLIYSLSKINRRYAYPAVLIEADMRAALEGIHMERVYRELLGRAGLRSSLLKLRRESRPFR